MTGRILKVLAALAGTVLLLFAPSAVTASRVDERIARSGLVFAAKITKLPIDTSRQTDVRVRTAGRDVTAWCAPLRTPPNWICVSLNEPKDNAAAAWISATRDGRIVKFLYFDEDPVTLPNP